MVLCEECGRGGALYGYVYQQPLRCKDCRDMTMFDAYIKRCPCNKASARFGILGGIPIYCGTCAKDMPGFINLKVSLCIKCKVGQRRYGRENECAEYCANCRTKEMLDLYAKRCDCPFNKIASFGYPEEQAFCCEKCRASDMKDIRASKCKKCNKSTASHGHPGMSATHCRKCQEQGMEDLNAKEKCRCGKAIPSFGYPNDEKATCCKICINDGMVNIVSEMCLCVQPNRQ